MHEGAAGIQAMWLHCLDLGTLFCRLISKLSALVPVAGQEIANRDTEMLMAFQCLFADLTLFKSLSVYVL